MNVFVTGEVLVRSSFKLNYISKTIVNTNQCLRVFNVSNKTPAICAAHQLPMYFLVSRPQYVYGKTSRLTKMSNEIQGEYTQRVGSNQNSL